MPNTVEDLIHISNLDNDYYNFDEKSLTLTGRSSHKQFRVGMSIKVKLTNADVEQHQLDFEIYDPNVKKRPQRGYSHGKRSFNKGHRNNNGKNNKSFHVNNGHNFKTHHHQNTAVKTNKK